jgi:hypothetical protein
MKFDVVERVADAVLYEGYLLYPYRASAVKNRMRWQFGIIAPQRPEDAEGEPWFSQTECLVQSTADTLVYVRVRFLTVDGGHGAKRSADIIPIDVSRAITREVCLGIDDLDAKLVVDVEPATLDVPDAKGIAKLQLRIENHEPWRAEYAGDRDAMLARSLVSAHLLLAVEHGAFISLLEPPEDAQVAVAACNNRHTWPVLAGDRTSRDLMLSSPILLYDYPAIAKESPGDLCDATEIDEILSLRIMTLTEEEKREARETDPVAARIIDRTDALTPAALGALHGTMRSADLSTEALATADLSTEALAKVDFFNPQGEEPPDKASVPVAGGVAASGAKVCLRPKRRADAMDMFLDGQAATVTGVYRDVDDHVYVAVTVDADPAAELHGSFGRYFYFNPDEIEMRNA